uniref:Uncharacterized protein LOC100374888 isoform X2 n=1 Tax=Saccoglossus kowalevskii TaxID=10224 RepID=A0ABM0MMP1_SACKO|nr:PREDICTED: uncharacterized protein LOC100374888 isoform X2 [Saccoglossus kowalevskii]
MTPWLSLLYLYMIVIVVVIDLTMSSVIRVPISGCKDGYFVYKIPPGIYRNKDGSDQSVYPGAMCRACSVCPDGAATLSPCSQTEDTVCGGCVKQGYVFDEGTKSCQPEYIIKGQAEPEKHFGLNEFGETASINAPFLADYEDGGTGVSASSVEMLLGAAATLFAVVATTTVVLIVVCVVSTIKQIKTGKRKNEQECKTETQFEQVYLKLPLSERVL